MMKHLIIFVLILFVYIYYSSVKQKLYYFVYNEAKLSSSLQSLLFENDIQPTNSLRRNTIIFFRLLTDYVSHQHRLKRNTNKLYINSLLSIDILSSKSEMYMVLKAYNSQQLLKKYVPKTYVIEKEYLKLLAEFNDDNLYILKKNVQRQKGCTITNDLEYIKKASDNGYVVCQELLQDPYCINGHKINIRQYMLIIVNKSTHFYLYNDGFIYYTPKPFKKQSMNPDRNITTGYIDRAIYDSNPLTLQDLLKSMNSKAAIRLKGNLKELFLFISKSYSDLITYHDSNTHTNFVILGCDVAVDNHLNCKIMEINKGPDLSYKDERDKEVKYKMMKNVFSKLNLININYDNFISLK